MSGRMRGGEAGLAEVGAAWLGASDDLLAGVGHALNNRVAALSAVGQVLSATTEGPLSAAISAESERLQRTVQLLRLLVRRWAAEPEAVQLPDVLGDVAELLRHHPDLREGTIRVEAESSLPPVWGERSALTHAFCLMLIPAAAAAEHAGEEAVSVRCSGTVEEVVIAIPFPAPPGSRPADGAEDDDQPPATAMDPRAAQGLIERAGGEISVWQEAGAIAGLQVRLPTLMEVRRREREGAPGAPG